MRDLDRIALLLFSEDPKRKAEKILAQLVAESGAKGGAVLAVQEGRLIPFVTLGVDLDQLTSIRSAWRSVRPALASGRTHAAEGRILAPIGEGADLPGVLTLESPRSFDEEDTQLMRALLAKALTTPAGIPSPVTSYLVATPPEEMAREQLLLMLRQHEWNIALVARRLGVTRRTVYLRLKRYGIARKKVPKTLKRTAST